MLTNIHVYTKRFLGRLADEEGANLGEYSLLVAFIAIVAIGSVTLVGGQIGHLWNTIVEVWP